jgi:hypothetical protein
MIEYSNAQYAAMNGVNYAINCLKGSVPICVPLDTDNTDYQNIMQLVAEGKLVIAPADA